MWKPDDNAVGSVLSFHFYVGSRDESQVLVILQLPLPVEPSFFPRT